MNFLGTSWKPKLAAILTLIGPAGLWFLLTTGFKMEEAQANAISGLVFAVLASFGLYNAKQSDVSHAPDPLIIAQPVEKIEPPK